jgi:hypothetical protein
MIEPPQVIQAEQRSAPKHLVGFSGQGGGFNPDFHV